MIDKLFRNDCALIVGALIVGISTGRPAHTVDTLIP